MPAPIGRDSCGAKVALNEFPQLNFGNDDDDHWKVQKSPTMAAAAVVVKDPAIHASCNWNRPIN